VLGLARLASFHLREDWGMDRAVSGAVEISLLGGRTLRHELAEPLGAPARPLSETQLVAKFVDCAGRGEKALAPERATVLAQRILNLAAEADAGELLAT
jgi:2-methylcitrate dehydratase PrpD